MKKLLHYLLPLLLISPLLSWAESIPTMLVIKNEITTNHLDENLRIELSHSSQHKRTFWMERNRQSVLLPPVEFYKNVEFGAKLKREVFFPPGRIESKHVPFLKLGFDEEEGVSVSCLSYDSYAYTDNRPVNFLFRAGCTLKKDAVISDPYSEKKLRFIEVELYSQNEPS